MLRQNTRLNFYYQHYSNLNLDLWHTLNDFSVLRWLHIYLSKLYDLFYTSTQFKFFDSVRVFSMIIWMYKAQIFSIKLNWHYLFIGIQDTMIRLFVPLVLLNGCFAQLLDLDLGVGLNLGIGAACVNIESQGRFLDRSLAEVKNRITNFSNRSDIY